MDILLHLVTAALYLLLSAHYFRAYRQGSAGGASSKAVRLACLAPIVLHGAILLGSVFHGGSVYFGLSAAVSMMVWLAVAVYWLESGWTRLDALQMLALPLAAMAVIAPLFLPPPRPVPADSGLFAAHFLVAMLAYALATLAALHAVMMAVVERRLHQGRWTRLIAQVPPLLVLESLLFRLIAVSFVLLTLTVGSGVLFSETVFGRALSFDHKTVFAMAAWATFGMLLLGRRVWGWRGRTALRWTLAGFFLLLLAYVGTHFVLEVILRRA